MSKAARNAGGSAGRKGRSAFEPGGSASSRACAASLASPTTATSAGCQRPIWLGAASAWSSGTLGNECPKLMVRRLRPAPNTTTQSAWSIMRRAAEWENEPTMPRVAGWPWKLYLRAAEVGRMAVEHVLAARRGREQRTGAVGELLDLGLGAGAMGAEAGQDHRLAALGQRDRRRPGGRGARRRRRPWLRERRRRRCLGEVELGELDVDREQQGHCPALQGCV